MDGTVTPSERLDSKLRDMGCTYVGKFAALDQSGRSVYQYLTPNGKMLFTYDLGDKREWAVMAPMTELPDMQDNLAAIKVYIEK